MEEVKYIPGDLVMTDGCPIGTKKGVVYVVTESDPNRTFTLKDGTVLKGSVTLDAITEEDKAYFVETSTWVKHIVPIKLTPQILKANGWLEIIDGTNPSYQSGRDWRLQIEFLKDSCIAYLHDEVLLKFKYINELQHLLFGLGLNSELNV